MTALADLDRSAADVQARRGRRIPVGWLAYVVGVAIGVGFGATTDGFFTTAGLRSILASTAYVGMVAVGLTPIVISGALFSLTLGTTVAMSAVLFVNCLKFGLAPAVIITLVVGLVVGAVQGWFVGALESNPIIVTLAAGALEAGFASWATKDSTQYPPPGYHGWQILSRTFAGIPASVFALVALAILVGLLMSRTTWGKQVYLVGDNRRAAFAAGLPVTRVMVGAFGLASFGAALSGIFLAAFSQNATTQIGGTLSFDAISAVLVGGTAIVGGRGSVLRTVIGAFIIAAISNMLLLRGYQLGVRMTATGVLVLVVVLVMFARDRWSKR